MLVSLVFFSKTYCQVQESGEQMAFQYAAMPSLGNHQLETYSFSFQTQRDFEGTGYVIDADYQSTQFTYFQALGMSNLDTYENVHLLALGLGYFQNLKKNWSLYAYIKPTLSSNFSTGLTAEDVIYGHGLQIQKRWDSNGLISELQFGVEYGTSLGQPGFYPILVYRNAINSSLSYQLGFPSNVVSYKPTTRHQIDLGAVFRGFYFNNSANVSFFGGEGMSNTKLVFSDLDLGITHFYRLQPRMATMVRIGFSASNNLQIEGNNELSLYDFNPNESVYFMMGLKYNLNMDFNGQKDE